MHFMNALYLLVIGFLSARVGFSIRVDWNTNKGPIIPPTPRTTQHPQLPYRQPAPVWEDQSDDIPNPNPYVYVLPPPSRPRPATNNYLTADRRPVTQENYYLYNNQNNYGSLLPPSQGAADYYQRPNGAVAGLSPKYIPNVGFKYFAIVSNNNNGNNGKSISSSTNGLTNGYYIDSGSGSGNDKLQGKYNAKTKKYKAYEKVKYVPPNYYTYNEFALPEMTSHHRSIFNQYDLLTAQQLPATEIAIPFNNGNIENFIQDTNTLKIHNEKQRQKQHTTEITPKSKLNVNVNPVKQQHALSKISKVAYSKDISFVVGEKPSKLNIIKQRKEDNEKSSYSTLSNAIKLNAHKEGMKSNITTTIHTNYQQ